MCSRRPKRKHCVSIYEPWAPWGWELHIIHLGYPTVTSPVYYDPRSIKYALNGMYFNAGVIFNARKLYLSGIAKGTE